MKGRIAPEFPRSPLEKNGDRPHFLLFCLESRISSFLKNGVCPQFYKKKEENKDVLLLDVKMKSDDYFFFK